MNLDWYRHNWRWFKHLWSEWRKRRTGSFPYGPEPHVNKGEDVEVKGTRIISGSFPYVPGGIIETDPQLVRGISGTPSNWRNPIGQEEMFPKLYSTLIQQQHEAIRQQNRMLAKARQRRRQTKEKWPMVKKGDILEYNPALDNPDYDGLVGDERPGTEARYAVAVKDENTETQTLLVNDGSREYVIPSRWVSAYAWFGWIPEKCEEIYYEINKEEFEDAQEDW